MFTPRRALALILVLGACSSSPTGPTNGAAPDAPLTEDTTTFGTGPDTVTVTEPDTVPITEPDTVTVTETDTITVTTADTDTAQDSGTADTAQNTPDADSTASSGDAASPDEAVDSHNSEPNLSEVRFVALGDVGEGNEKQYEVAAAIEAKCAADGCDFAILLGDNVYDAGVSSIVDSQWEQKFEGPYANLDFPFYAVLGNHDNGGLLSDLLGDTFDGAGAEFEKGDLQVAYTSVSDKWTMPDRTYDFEMGPAHFFALDTNDFMWAPAIDEAEDRANTQIAEFPGKLDASDATWKIVFGHHPYISNGAHGNAGEYEGLDEDVMSLADAIPFLGGLLDGIGDVATGVIVKAGLEAILCNRADLYMSGHDHNRQWLMGTLACPGVQFVVNGAGAKTKELGGSNPTSFEDAETPGFLYIHIAGPTLVAEFIDMNGVVNFSTTMEK